MPRRRPNLDRLDAKDDVGGLIAALAPAPRDVVIEFDGSQVDAGVARRLEAAERLSSRADRPDVADGLRAALSDDSPQVRAVAARALVKATGETDGQIVAAILSLEDGEAREAAASELLVATSAPTQRSQLLETYSSVSGTTAAFGQEWVTSAATTLSQSERSGLVRGTADRLLGTSDPGRAWQIAKLDPHVASRSLLPSLTDETTRLAALRAMANLRSASVVDDVMELTEHDDPAVRLAAIETLGAIRHPRCVESLLRATIDDEHHVRDAAMAALDRLGTAGSVWGMASVARGVIAETGSSTVGALTPPAQPEAATASPRPQRDDVPAVRPRRRWRRS